jgi:hypothetical protein
MDRKADINDWLTHPSLKPLWYKEMMSFLAKSCPASNLLNPSVSEDKMTLRSASLWPSMEHFTGAEKPRKTEGMGRVAPTPVKTKV